MSEPGARVGRTIADSTPYWPSAARPPEGAPNILVVLFDDVGFSDFGCFGGDAATPTIDRFADRGLRYTGFHTTAMCSTTRAALLTGRNHHAVGMGCLANFDSGYPGYRGKIARSAGTLAEMLRPHGYRNYMTGKWHVTPLYETGPVGPVDGWPLGRGFDRFYGFLDAETDQYAPELVRDNTHVSPPGTFATGYHLTADLVDEAIRMIAEHVEGAPGTPWFSYLAFGACHAPHQVPGDLIDGYEPMFASGWDATRDRRLARMIDLGIVPAGTPLPPRNDGVEAWGALDPGRRRLGARLMAAYTAMLHHADAHLARLADFLERTGQLDDTLVLVASDNGASQEGGPLGFVNALGPFNGVEEPIDDKLARLDDIGGPDTHSNFPWGWAMAANTPLKRYKQNTHGGGIRDPLVVSWPNGIGRHGELRHHFCHASDVVPTLLDVVGIDPPAEVNGVAQQPLTGTSFAATLTDSGAITAKSVQYFEMFGHRGLWVDGWKAVAYHPLFSSFDDDVWELYHLDADMNEVHDLAAAEPDRLAAMVDRWWAEAEANQVLPLDDRFGERFAETADRVHGHRRRYEFWKGMGHIPTDVAPDVRSRSYRISAEVTIPDGGATGVLVAHGDATSGYSLYLGDDGHLVHDLNIGGSHQLVRSSSPVPPGRHDLVFDLARGEVTGNRAPGIGRLLVDGVEVARMETVNIFWLLVSFSGLDIGLDRGSPVSHYVAPFAFTGELRRVTVEMTDDQLLDEAAAGRAQLARVTIDLTPLVARWPDPAAAAIAARTVDGVVGRGGDTARVSRIASVSKLFVSLACLVAVEEGTIELDEPAGRPGATIRHLLAHAAGYDFDRPEFVAAVGARRVYSNIDIEVLAEHVSRRAGMPFAEYQREAVFLPLELTATKLRGSPAFDIHSSVDDLLTLAGELLAPTLIAPSTLAEAVTEQFPGLSGVLPGWGRFDPLPWGLGFEIKGDKSPHWSGRRTSPQTFGHFGGSGTYLFVDPVAGLAGAAISGTDFDKWAVAAWPEANDELFDQVVSEAAAEGR